MRSTSSPNGQPPTGSWNGQGDDPSKTSVIVLVSLCVLFWAVRVCVVGPFSVLTGLLKSLLTCEGECFNDLS